jgi:hypothetical protein
MKRLLLVVAAVAALAVPASSTAAKPSGVYLFECDGGLVKVPAETPVNIWFGWFERNAGLVWNFLDAQTTTLTVDGVAVPDASSFWGPTEDRLSGGVVSYWQYSPGVLARPGDSVVVTVDVSLSRKLPEKDDDGNLVFVGPGSAFGAVTCTIVAV